MKKKFLSNLVLLVVINLLIKPFWFFGIEVGVQNRVGEESYGLYFALFNFAFILNILLDLGITNYNNRRISRNPNTLEEALGKIAPLKFLLSLFYAVFVIACGLIVGYEANEFKILWVLILNQFLSSFILYLRSNISGIQRFRTDSLLSVLDRTLMIIINAVLLWGGKGEHYRIEWFVWSQTASYILTLAVTGSLVAFYSGKITWVFNWKKQMQILKNSYPFAILILLMSFFNRIDSVFLERMITDGDYQAGIYAQSFRVLDAVSSFAVLFAGLLLPMFSRMLKTGEKVDELVRLALSLLMIVSLSVAVAGQFFAFDIIELMYHEVQSGSEKIFAYLMIGFVFISISYVYGTLLTANGSLKQLNILAGFTVIINIALNLILIPRMKAEGAAIASMISQGFYAFAQMIVAHQVIQLEFSWSKMLKIVLFLALSVLSAHILNSHFNWIPALLLFIGISPLLALGLRILRINDLQLL